MNVSTAVSQETSGYPLSLRMDGRLAVVVGAGAVAVRRVAGLRAAGAGGSSSRTATPPW